MYNVETKNLNLSVKRNIKRFPDDFMFQLTKKEWESLRLQNETSKRGGRITLMKAKAFVLVAFLTVCISLSAQENETKEKYTYSNITELGYAAVSLKGVLLEIATVNGVAIAKQHHFGLGVGFGTNVMHTSFEDVFIYMPIFFNYRYYFKPEKKFSPHVNASLGGIAMEKGYGVHSSFTAGFKAGAFSFSSGLSFIPINKEINVVKYRDAVDAWGFPTTIPYSVTEWKWFNLFGIVVKCGFSF